MKRIALVLLLLFVSTITYSQSPVTFGPKVGFITSKLKSDISELEEDFKAGFQAGIFLRGNIKKLYIQPELYYAVKGGNLDSTNSNQEFTLSTLDVPIIVGYKVIGKEAFNFRIFAGPVASFILNKKIKLNGDEIADDLAEKSLQDAIWGLQMGVGFDVLMFTLDVRYELGLNDISSSDTKGSVKSNSFHISLGWKIL